MNKLRFNGWFGRDFNARRLVVFGAFFAVIGVATLLLAKAATLSANLEPENGARSANIATGSDVAASNGQYVQFMTGTPAGGQFFEAFTADQRSRFDWQLQTTAEPIQRTYLGEHDTSCGISTTYRTITPIPLQTGISHTKVDATNSNLVWWCPQDNGHIMTGMDSDSIAALAFSPKQIFTNVKKVCWDQSMFNISGGKWVNIMIVPNADVVAKNNDLNYVGGNSMSFRSSDQFLPVGAVDFSWQRGSIASHTVPAVGTYDEAFSQWMSIDPQDTNGNGEIDPGDTPTQGMATTSDQLFTICMDDASNHVTIERPNGVTDTYAYNVAFPTGQVRVIFQDANKTPTKYVPNAKHLTWHWDNIVIE